MNGQDFLRIIDDGFVFLNDFDFLMDEPHISGRMYQVEFRSPTNVLTVAYEPSENNLTVYLSRVKNGQRSNVDDERNTFRLNQLNRTFMKDVTTEERKRNEEFFRSVSARDPAEKLLLKAAKDLRLILPKYLSIS